MYLCVERVVVSLGENVHRCVLNSGVSACRSCSRKAGGLEAREENLVSFFGIEYGIPKTSMKGSTWDWLSWVPSFQKSQFCIVIPVSFHKRPVVPFCDQWQGLGEQCLTHRTSHLKPRTLHTKCESENSFVLHLTNVYLVQYLISHSSHLNASSMSLGRAQKPPVVATKHCYSKGYFF